MRDYLRGCARSYPEKIAWIDGERRRSWREMDERSDRLAAALQGLGARKGDVSAVLAHDHVEVIEHWYACWKSGVVRTGINWRYAAREMMHLIRDARVRVLIIQANCVPLLHDHLEELRGAGVVLVGFGENHGLPSDYETLIAEAAPPPWPDLADDDPISITYTTGTTGLPKGAVIPQVSVREAVTQMVTSMGLRHEDVWASLFPLPGIPILIASFSALTGMTTVLPDGDFNAATFVELAARHRITGALFVPTMLRRVLEEVQRTDSRLDALRLVVYGSMPCPPALIQAAYDQFGCEFQQYYGLSEGGGWFTCLRDGDHRRALAGEPHLLTSCGRRMIGGDASVRNEDGEPVAPGDVGELWVKGDTLMLGYMNRPADSEALFGNGWLRTHDLARMDEDGYVYLVDRKNFLIISGGYNVYPVTVENVISEYPGIREVCVIGAPHPEWGEAVVAVVSLQAGALFSAAALLEYCRERVGKWEVPKYIHVIDDLPKGATGKIQKNDVRTWFREGTVRPPWDDPAALRKVKP